MKSHISTEDLRDLKPSLSIIFIICALMSVVFLQMEERRIGYAILKLNKEHRKVIEEKRVKTMQLAKLTRPQHIERVAESKLTLRKIQNSQIIHLTGSTVAAQKGAN